MRTNTVKSWKPGKTLTMNGSERQHSILELAWATLRLPLLLIIAFLFRQQIIDAVIVVIGVGKATLLAIDVLSIPATRVLFLCAMATILLICAAFTKNLSLFKSYVIICAVGFALIAVAIYATGKSKIYIVPGFLLLATNLLPANIHSKYPIGIVPRWVMICGLALSEAFLFWRHIRWVTWLWTGRPWPDASRRWVCGVARGAPGFGGHSWLAGQRKVGAA
jgi:hypothetical protein